MAPKIKNIIIFSALALIFILLYIFFIRKAPDQANLVSSASTPSPTTSVSSETGTPDSLIAKDFLSLLLSVKNIKLDDSIFSNIAFTNLHDSSITLIPDGTEGRPNPFAPFGADSVAPPANTNTSNTNTPNLNTPAPIKP